jgi:hypothetical protein
MHTKEAKLMWATFKSYVHIMYILLEKKLFGLHFGYIFTNSSGHPEISLCSYGRSKNMYVEETNMYICKKESRKEK